MSSPVPGRAPGGDARREEEDEIRVALVSKDRESTPSVRATSEDPTTTGTASTSSSVAPSARSSLLLRRSLLPRDSSSPSHSDTYEDATSEPQASSSASAAPGPPFPPGGAPRRGSSVGPPEVSFAGPFPHRHHLTPGGHRRSGSEFSDLMEPLPPPETFFVSEATSLDGSVIENDLLPSTPLTEEQLRRAEAEEVGDTVDGVAINKIEDVDADAEADYWGYDIRGMMHNAAEQAEEFAVAIWHKLQSWKVIHFSSLPQWLQDNDFLHFGHRPPLPTIECFKSITRIHTETGNIWTHLLGKYQTLVSRPPNQSSFLFIPLIGVAAFFGLATYFLSRPLTEVQVQEKLVFSCFFMGAIVCLGLSFLYHTLCCHKDKAVGKLFAK